jgi:hypothetical protein
MDVSLQTTEASLEETEASQGKVEIKMEAGLEEMQSETIRALEARYGDRLLAVGLRDRPKKRTQGDG